MNRRDLISSGTALALLPAAAFGQSQDPRIAAIETGLIGQRSLLTDRPATILERMAALNIPGVSVAMFDRTRILWAKGYGVADARTRAPVTPDTVFQAASISKSVTAVAAMRMAAAGKLALDEDVNLRLRGWRVPDSVHTRQEKVTARRILSHTAGLSVHGFAGYRPGSRLPDLIQTLNGRRPANNRAVKSEMIPGARFQYSGGGYSVLQLLMEEAEGAPFDQIARRLVLDPARMGASTFEVEPPALKDWLATAHDAKGKPLPGGHNVYPMEAASSLWTTASDIARFGMELLKAERGQASPIVTPATIRAMAKSPLNDGVYGVGFELNTSGILLDDFFGHGGSNAGFKSFYLCSPAASQGVVVMTNGENGGQMMFDIIAACARAYGWKMTPRLAEVPMDAAGLARVAGTYRGPQGSEYRVAVEGGKLMLTLPGATTGHQVFPASRDRFFYLLAEGVMEFGPAGAGPPTRMTYTSEGRSIVAERVR